MTAARFAGSGVLWGDRRRFGVLISVSLQCRRQATSNSLRGFGQLRFSRAEIGIAAEPADPKGHGRDRTGFHPEEMQYPIPEGASASLALPRADRGACRGLTAAPLSPKQAIGREHRPSPTGARSGQGFGQQSAISRRLALHVR